MPLVIGDRYARGEIASSGLTPSDYTPSDYRLFAGIMEWIAHTRKEPSLLDGGEAEPEAKPVEVESKE